MANTQERMWHLTAAVLAVYEKWKRIKSPVTHSDPVPHIPACRQVEIKTTPETPSTDLLQKAADFVHAYILGARRQQLQTEPSSPCGMSSRPMAERTGHGSRQQPLGLASSAAGRLAESSWMVSSVWDWSCVCRVIHAASARH